MISDMMMLTVSYTIIVSYVMWQEFDHILPMNYMVSDFLFTLSKPQLCTKATDVIYVS